MFKNFRYINNLPLFIASWLGCAVFGVILMPMTHGEGVLFFIYLAITIVCFILFGYQCLKAFAQRDQDAARGAALREQEKEKRSN